MLYWLGRSTAVTCVPQDERGPATGPPQDGDDSWVDVGRHDAASKPAAADELAAAQSAAAECVPGTAAVAGKLGWRRYLRMYVAGAAVLCLRQPPNSDASGDTGFVLVPSRQRSEGVNGTT